MTPIAIVGIGCRFAGAPDPHALWHMSLQGRHAFGPPPPDRWDHAAFFDTNRRATDRSYAPVGGFLDDVRTFPALHFGIPPRRVEVMDPQQRMAIEVAHEAVADAGYRLSEVPRRTGVFIGVTASEYRTWMGSRVVAQLMASGALGTPNANPDDLAAAVDRVAPSRPFSAPGALANMVAAAVAQELDLHGPAFTTDAACASALVAVHDAVDQLRAGRIDAALAGGAYLCLSPENHIAFSRIGAISATGWCRPFDARSDGFVQGDGVGLVLLRRLDDALAAGDRIYAVIRGIALNNDGRGDGPMAPNAAGQADVIREAWRESGRGADTLGYIEAHGTGTDVGDVTEVAALRDALGCATGAFIGSTKANVGHTMSAAGVAGLVRAAQVLHYGIVPPLAGYAEPRADVRLDQSGLVAPSSPVRMDRPLAAISAFGFGGTNGHAVLERAPAPTRLPDAHELWLLSAPDDASLRAFAARIASALAEEPGATNAGVARALAVRPPLPARAAITSADLRSGIERLTALAEGRPASGLIVGTAVQAPRVAWLFPGQGAQRPGMLRAIARRFPAVEQDLAEAEAILVACGLPPLRTLLWPSGDAEAARVALRATEVCQPVLFAVSEALRRLLASLGLRPHVVAGHSLGEFNAAAAAGVVDPSAALRFVAARGKAMATMPGDPGAMVALRADADTIAPLLQPGAVIANRNHPSQVVVSGRTEAVAAVAERASAAGLDPVALEVSHGFHSPVFDDLDVASLLVDLPMTSPVLPVATAFADHPYADATEACAVFGRHASSPVDFVGALRQCIDAGADHFLQVGAGGPLASFARRVAPQCRTWTLSGMDDDDGVRTLLDGLGALWTAGADFDPRPLCQAAPVTSLPPTPLPRESYWVVKDEPQLGLRLAGPAGPRPAAATSAPPAPDESPADDVFDRVAGVVARVSSYPRASLRPDQGLLDDLGFDSLMVADLSSGLADTFPGLGGLPQELLLRKPTVGDLVAHVRGGAAGTAAHPEDGEPLQAWSQTWVATPLPEATAPPQRARGRRFEIAGDVPGLGDRLRGAGATEGRGDLLVWVAPTGGPSAGDVLSGAARPVDHLDALLDRLGESPHDLLVVYDADDLWSAGLCGAVRALAREWPDAVVKAITADQDVADCLLREWVSDDRTTEPRWTNGVRFVPGFASAPSAIPQDIGPNDVVALSGGTRGLGARLGRALQRRGAQIVLLGRGEPDDVAAEALSHGARRIVGDVLDPSSLRELAGCTVVVHAAGVLADGPVGSVDRERGRACRRVKVDGFLNLVAAAGPSLRLAAAVGSWAGAMGSRHQVHYAAANAQLAALAAAPGGPRKVVGSYGPVVGSAMVGTLPSPIASAMRGEGVDFATADVAVDALLDDLTRQTGSIVRGRDLPHSTRRAVRRVKLDPDVHPFLRDHAIDGVPVLPMAAAADLCAWGAGLTPPFAVEDLTLFTGVAVREAVDVSVHVAGDRAEIRVGPKQQLAWRARVRPCARPSEPPEVAPGVPATLTLRAFYSDVTFHGPLLQGLVAVHDVGTTAHGLVRTGTPAAWGLDRTAWAVDPLALDSAFQLAAFSAWQQWHRAGLPVAMRRLEVLGSWSGTLSVALAGAPPDGNEMKGDFVLRDASGALVAVVYGAVAELRGVAEATVYDPITADPARWTEVVELRQRLDMAAAVGIRNPYFALHEGTARNTTVVGGRTLVNFSSYNYLGLSGDRRVLDAVKDAVDRYGTSVSASRVASGQRPFHVALEAELAAAQGAEDAVVFTAGHATNVTTIGHLMGPGDLVLHDELIHDSALQGIKLSGAGRRGFRHDDPGHLGQLLRELRAHHRRVLVVVEGVYSMDGDLCALPDIVDLKERHGALLMVDEAHSFGIVGARGCGIGEHYGIDGRRVDLWMGTLSKSLASCGGWIAGNKPVIEFLRYSAPGFVYSAGLTPANGVAALRSLQLMLEEPWRVARLQANAKRFHDGLVARGVDTGPSRGGSGVVPAVTGNSLHALMLSQRLNDQGINVQPIVYPAVADDAARLRFFLSSTHTDDELDSTANAVATTLQAVRADFPV